jgi:hypothetical protein
LIDRFLHLLRHDRLAFPGGRHSEILILWRSCSASSRTEPEKLSQNTTIDLWVTGRWDLYLFPILTISA